MFGDGLIQGAIEKILERIREVESIKAPLVVHGFTWLKMAAMGERAKSGMPVMEPYGSSRQLLGLEDLVFKPAMINKLPVDPKQVNTNVVIGKNAAKPLKISTPIMLSALAFGLSVTKEVKTCWAKAAAMNDTASNSGDAGFYQEERALTKHYIVQYNRAGYGNSEEELKQADAIEIRFGQAALAGIPESIDGEDVDEKLAKSLGVKVGQSTSRPIHYPEFDRGEGLKEIVAKLRGITDGVPIGAKIAAGDIEADLDRVIEAGCDFVTIDGMGGGTAGSPEVIINNTGMPLIYAIPRANKHLQERGVRDRISLIVCGGLRDAGDFLKAMALGADAVYVAQAALIAMVYSQMHRVPPGKSPGELFFYWGDHHEDLDVDEATAALSNFIKASTQEMALLAGAAGKNDVGRVSIDDMVALTRESAEITGVAPAAFAWGG